MSVAFADDEEEEEKPKPKKKKKKTTKKKKETSAKAADPDQNLATAILGGSSSRNSLEVRTFGVPWAHIRRVP